MRNLLTNPSCATAGAPVTVWENLLTNPSAEAVAPGTTVLRRNLARNPSVASDTTDWVANGSALGASTRETTGGPSGVVSTWFKVSLAGAPSDSVYVNVMPSGSNAPAVIPGGAYTFSSYVITTVPGTQWRILFVWYQADGSLSSTSATDWATSGTGWFRAGGTMIAPSGAAYARGRVEISNFASASAGQYLGFTATLFEQTDQLRPYFDGDTPDALGWDYGWEGTANASVSTAKAAHVAVRTNLALNPRGVGALGDSTIPFGWVNQWWGGGSGTGVYESVPGGGLRRRWTVDASTDFDVWIGGKIAVTPGDVMSFRVTAAIDSAPGGISASGGLALLANFRDAADASMGTSLIGAVKPWNSVVLGESFVLENLNVIVPAGAVSVRFYPYPSGSMPPPPKAGTVLRVDKLQAEKSPVLGSYFDGSTPSAGDFSYAWTGAANGSTSVQMGVALNFHTNPELRQDAVLVGSWAWKKSGNLSTRLIPNGTAFRSAIYWTGLALGLQAGKTYTALVICRLAAPLTGTLNASALTLSLNDGASSVQAPNTAGEHLLRLTFAWNGSSILRLYGGNSVGTGDVWWDDVLVVEGVYTGPYFDGATPLDDPDLTTAWTGTPHASTTKVQGVGVTGIWGGAGRVTIQSSQWSSSGMKSMRTIPNSNISSIGGALISLSGLVTPGQPYTVLARLRLAAPQTGTITEPARRIWVGNTAPLAQSSQAPNVAGEHIVRMFVPSWPSAVDGVAMRFSNGATAGGGDVWWDDLLLVEGDYQGPYFDGDSPDAAWDGTPHASTSQKQFPALSYWDGTEEHWVAASLGLGLE